MRFRKSRSFPKRIGTQPSRKLSYPAIACRLRRWTSADGGGGGAGTDAQVIKLARKTPALGAKIEQLEQRNGILEGPIRTPNSIRASAMNHLKRFASSPP